MADLIDFETVVAGVTADVLATTREILTTMAEEGDDPVTDGGEGAIDDVLKDYFATLEGRVKPAVLAALAASKVIRDPGCALPPGVTP